MLLQNGHNKSLLFFFALSMSNSKQLEQILQWLHGCISISRLFKKHISHVMRDFDEVRQSAWSASYSSEDLKYLKNHEIYLSVEMSSPSQICRETRNLEARRVGCVFLKKQVK